MEKSNISSRKFSIPQNSVLFFRIYKNECEIEECGNYQHSVIFIENVLAVKITMISVKKPAANFRDKFRVNEHDKLLRKEQSMRSRLKTLFPNDDIEEKHSSLHFITDFKFKSRMLMIEIDEKGCVTGIQIMKKRQKELEDCGYYLIGIDPDKKDFNDYEEFGRLSAYIGESLKKTNRKIN